MRSSIAKVILTSSRAAYSVFRMWAAIVCVVICGCEAQPGFVAKEWSNAMRELQILPVFPPREDVRIGDMVVLEGETREAVEAAENRVSMPDRSAGYLPVPVLVARHDFGAELAKQYSQGPQFRQTPTTAPAAGSLYQPQPLLDGAYTAGQTNRPRLCGMPEFMSATFSSGDLSALVPTEAVSVAASAGFQSAKEARLSVPFAEHYALPMSEVWAKINSEEAVRKLRPTLKALFGSKPSGADGTVGYIRVVNEVFLARSIDVTLTSSAAGGARVGVRPVVGGTRDLVRDGEVADAGGGSATADELASGDDFDPEMNPLRNANRLNAQLKSANASQGIGGQFGFVSASASSIGMRRTFEYPQVIGYRGPLLRVERNEKGEYVLAGMTPVPSGRDTAPIQDPDDEVPVPAGSTPAVPR